MKTMIFVAMATTAMLYACSPKINSSKHRLLNTISTDKNGKPMLIGECDKAGLEKEPFSEWFNKNYADYKINDSLNAVLTPLTANKNFLLFMGTWCGDSKREVPRIFKILENSGVKSSQIKMIMVDNHDSTYKQSPGHEEQGLNIHRVPTLLVYDSNKELGRIVESPVVSLEEDLYDILNKEGYRPNYKAVIYLDSLFRHTNMHGLEKNISGEIDELKPLIKNAAELNTYGYVLMSAKEMEKAGLVFRLNTMLYPADSNIFDSLGEYYFKTGNKELAKENYMKVLELEPGNKNAKEMLGKM